MAKDYSPYQQKLIRNYYRNRDAIDAQRLAELVTEIYLATAPKKQARLWERARALLERGGGLKPDEIEALVAARDVESLAAIAGASFG